MEDRQSRIAWQTINEVSGRKSTAKAKLKAASQQERIKLWEQHFKNLLGNPPEITDEPITRIISKQLDVKLGPFTKEELDTVLRRIKNRKAAGLDEIPPEVWKTRAPYLFIICLDYVLRTSIDKIRENGFELTKRRSKRYPAKTITDADYADDLALLANTPNQAETLLHSLERAAAGIGLHVNANKTEYMCYNQTGNIATLDGASLKLVDKFTYLGSSVSSTEKDIDTRLTKAWTAIDRLSIIWKSDLTDKMKRSFFQAAVVSILLYGCTTWTLTKRLERRLDGNYTRMLRAVLNKSWRQHPTRLQLYGHLPPITKTIQVRRTRHAGHCWRSKDELISDVLLWTPTHGCASVGRPARTYIQQLCEDTGCNPEDLPEAMSDREKWRETVRDIRADGAT